MAIKKLRGRNEGSISQRSNGSYRAQVSSSGKRVSASFRTKAEAQKWIRDQLIKLEGGVRFPGKQDHTGSVSPTLAGEQQDCSSCKNSTPIWSVDEKSHHPSPQEHRFERPSPVQDREVLC